MRAPSDNYFTLCKTTPSIMSISSRATHTKQHTLARSLTPPLAWDRFLWDPNNGWCANCQTMTTTPLVSSMCVVSHSIWRRATRSPFNSGEVLFASITICMVTQIERYRLRELPFPAFKSIPDKCTEAQQYVLTDECVFCVGVSRY